MMDLISDNISPAANTVDDVMQVDNFEPLTSTPTIKLYAGSNIRLLPPEILFLILQRAIPPYTLLDTTLAAGGNSAWCQTIRLMHSIVLVCRSWSDVAITFLYENVCIRRYHQLQSLRQTLTNSTSKHLTLLVKSLTIQCYIPKDRDLEFCADLEAVMRCCTSLSTFEYNAAFVPPEQAMKASFPPHITHLRLEGYFDYDKLFNILTQLDETLLSIHLTVWDTNFENSTNGQKMLRSHLLFLPSLQSLSVAVLRREKFSVLDIVRSRWVMPSLQSLTVSIYDCFHLGNEICEPDLQMAVLFFLALHGSQVRQLQIGVNGFRFDPETFKQLLDICPQLERIILHPSTFLRKFWTDSDDFFHPRLRWIDFTHYLRDIDDYGSSELCLSKRNLPALEGVRHFCNFPRDLQKWLGAFPPSADAEKEEFVIDVFQHQLDCHEGVYVWRFEPDSWEDGRGGVFSGSYDAWADLSSDAESGDYVPSSDEWDVSSQEPECEWTTDDEDLSDL